MITNEPLKRCFANCGVLTAHAAIKVLNACNWADALYKTPNFARDCSRMLQTIPGGYGQYFPVGVEVAAVQAAITKAAQHLNGVIQAAANASGEPTPPELPPYVFHVTPGTLNKTQTELLNACIEFVRVTVPAALYWLERLTDRGNYEREARRAGEMFAGVREVIPLTPADEMEAAAAMVPIREQVEAIRAALNIPNYPEMSAKELNARLYELGRALDYLTEPVTTSEQAAAALSKYADLFGDLPGFFGWDNPNPNAWNIPGNL